MHIYSILQQTAIKITFQKLTNCLKFIKKRYSQNSCINHDISVAFYKNVIFVLFLRFKFTLAFDNLTADTLRMCMYKKLNLKCWIKW